MRFLGDRESMQSRTLEVQLAETGRSFVSESARADQGANSEVYPACQLRNVIVRAPLPKYWRSRHGAGHGLSLTGDRGTLHGGDNDTTLSGRCKRLDQLHRLLNFRKTTWVIRRYNEFSPCQKMRVSVELWTHLSCPHFRRRP